MYLLVLQGQTTSFSPAARGLPTECRAGTNSLSPRAAHTAVPMRVMMRMLATTYGESESSTPMWASGEPTGPIENGMTYIVRPAMEPLKRGRRVSFICFGAIQSLAGPAPLGLIEHTRLR